MLFQTFFLQVEQIADILVTIKRLASVSEPLFQFLAEASEQIFPVGTPTLQDRSQFCVFFTHILYYKPIFCSSRSTIRTAVGTVTVSSSLEETSSVKAAMNAAGKAVSRADRKL